MRLFFSVAGASLMASSLVLAACGEDAPTSDAPTNDAGSSDAAAVDDASPDTTNALALTVTPAAVEATYGGKTDVAVSIVWTGAVGDVSLGVKNLPAGITATFSPATLTPAVTESTLTLAIGKEAPLGASTLEVVGTWGGEESTQALALAVKDIAVSGKVASGATGVTVVLDDGQRRVTTTTSGGAFTFQGVKPPYDLYTVTHTDAAFATITDQVSYYKGLTRPDPTVEAPLLGGVAVVPPSNKATIAGTLSGTAAPLSASTPLFLFWTGSSDDPAARISGGLSYSFERSWLGLTVGKHTGTVHALQYDTGLAAWRGYASGAIALANGDAATVGLPMTTPVNAKATGSITAPVGFSSPSVLTIFTFDSRSYRLSGLGTTTPFELSFPVVPASTMGFEFSSKLGDALSEVSFSEVKADIDVTYALKEPPVLTGPADAAAATYATSFEWAAQPGAVSVVRWTVGKVRYELFTTDGKAAVPDVPEKRLPADNATWRVDTHGPMTSVDELAGPKGRSLDAAPIRYHTATDGKRKFVWSP